MYNLTLLHPNDLVAKTNYITFRNKLNQKIKAAKNQYYKKKSKQAIIVVKIYGKL